MIYDDIYLVLTDVSMTESTNTRERSLTVTYDETVRDTFRPHWQIMKDLKSCTNTASLSIKSKSAGEWIMQADGNIHCKVYQGDPTAIGNLPIFTGYLADKYTWGFTTGGDKVLNITIEDPTRVLDRIYTDSPTYKSWNTLLAAITDIITEVNSHLATEEQIGIGTVQTVVKDLSKRIDDDETCQNLLDTLCFECQGVLYFDTQGNINTLSIANAEETGLPEGYTEVSSSGVLDRSNLIAYNGKDVWSVQKEVLQYKNAKCYGKTLKSYNNALVYKVTEGNSSSHPDCYVEVPTRTAFPSGVTIEYSSEDTELKLVNNVGKILEGEGQGKDVIAMSNVVAEVGFTGDTPWPGTGHAYIEKINDLQMWCLAKNMSASSIYVTKWQATANVIVEDETIVERTGDALDLEKVYEYECEFLHDRESIQQLSNMIAQYYTNSNKKYTFYTKLDLNLGTTVYDINASPYGLSTKVLPYKKETLRDIYKYTAVGWAPFDLVADTNSKKYVPWSPGPGPVGPQGPQGDPGEDGEDGDTIVVTTLYALSTSSTVAPTTDTSGKFTTPINPEVGYKMRKYLWKQTESHNVTQSTYSYSTPEYDASYTTELKTRYKWSYTIDPTSFVQNLRAEDSEVDNIFVKINRSHYENVTTSVSANVPAEKQSWDSSNQVLTIYRNATLLGELEKCELRIALVDSTSPSQTVESDIAYLDVVDETEYGKCWDYVSDPSTITGTLVVGDFFVADGTNVYYPKGTSYEWTGTSWIPLEASDSAHATKLLSSLNILKTHSVDLNDVNDANTVSWFNTIIASKGVFDKLFAEEITVSGETGVIQSANYNGSVGQSTTNNFTQGFKLSAYDGRIRAANAVFLNAEITDSHLTGTIDSGPLTTKEARASTSLSLTLQNTPYWNTNTFKQMLEGVVSREGYDLSGNYVVTGNYDRILIGSEVIVERDSSATWMRTISQITIPYTGRYSFDFQSRYPNNGVEWWIGSGEHSTSFTGFTANAGDIFYFRTTRSDYRYLTLRIILEGLALCNGSTITYIPAGLIYQPITSIELVPNIRYRGIPIPCTWLFKWNNSILTGKAAISPSEASGTFSFTQEDMSGISNATAALISWTDDSSLAITDTLGNHYTLSSNSYYAGLSSYNLTVTPQAASISTIDITPKVSSTTNGNTLGKVNRPWRAAYATDFIGNVTGNVTGDISGNATTSTETGDGTIMIVPSSQDEINFGGSSEATYITFGNAPVNGRHVPELYFFGHDGNAHIQANIIYGTTVWGAVFN